MTRPSSLELKMVEVILISKTEVTKDFLPLTHKLLKRNIAKGLDDRRLKFDYLATLVDFKCQGADPKSEPGSLLKHLHFSFLVLSQETFLYDIAVEGLLGITMADNPPRGFDVAIMSANMEEWRTTIINGCTELTTEVVREFCTKVLLAFDLLGYTYVFDGYTRKRTSDNSLLLEYKG